MQKNTDFQAFYGVEKIIAFHWSIGTAQAILSSKNIL